MFKVLVCAVGGVSIFLATLQGFEGSPDDIFLKDRPIILSLGPQCEVASKINVFGYRNAAFLFDWILSVDINGIIDLLNNDFQFFFDEEYFEPHDYHAYVLVHKLYRFEYRHDWRETSNFWDDFFSYRLTYQNIKDAYERRINRFKRLGQFKGKVFFLRAAFDINTESKISTKFSRDRLHISAREAIALRDALRRHFPVLDFKLVIINYKEEDSSMLEIGSEEDIIEFQFRKSSKDTDYENLFHALLD